MAASPHFPVPVGRTGDVISAFGRLERVRWYRCRWAYALTPVTGTATARTASRATPLDDRRRQAPAPAREARTAPPRLQGRGRRMSWAGPKTSATGTEH